MKYNYWHCVTSVADHFKNKIKVGEILGWDHKKEGAWHIVNRSSGTFDEMCVVRYIGRTPVDLSPAELTSWVKKYSQEVRV